MIRLPLVFALAAAVAIALTGCTQSTSHPDFTQIRTGTVVATGDFGTAGLVRGSVRVVKTASDFELQLDDFEAPAGDELHIAARKTRPGCYDSWGVGFGDPSTWTSPDIPDKLIGLHLVLLLEPDGSHPDLLDPTFFTAIAVTAPRASDGCALTTDGAAQLTWSIPPLRQPPHPVDSGSTVGASGTVTDGANGSPRRYLIASGDTLDRISTRFNITLDDLYYLNPTRLTTSSSRINAGDELNLSPSDRGS